jgi:hypothetical protein
MRTGHGAAANTLDDVSGHLSNRCRLHYAGGMQPTKSKVRIAHTFRLSSETIARLRAAARADLRSMNSAVEVACLAWLAEREAQSEGAKRKDESNQRQRASQRPD